MTPTRASEYQDYGWGEGPTEAHHYLFPTLCQLLINDKGKRILDLGCGNGLLAGLLLDAGYDVYGVDGSDTGIAVANGKAPGRFFVHDFSHESLPDEIEAIPFDLIISTEVIEHLYNPRGYMRLIQKLLYRHGGDLVISTPYHGYLKNVALAISNKLDSHFTALWDGGHIKFWSRRTLTQLLNEFDFEVTDFRGSGRLPLLWKSMFIRAHLPART